MRLLFSSIVFILLCNVNTVAQAPRFTPSAQEIADIKSKSLKLLQEIKPNRSSQSTIEVKEGTAVLGPLFDKNEIVALVTLHPIKSDEFDYPPWPLSYLRWSQGKWEFKQLLGSASRFKIHNRKDLKLTIIQGFCQTGRHEGEQSSWRYRQRSQDLIPTELDKWGEFYIKGNYICYTRGAERLAHWDTRWIYSFVNGKLGELLACLHEDDQGKFTITFSETTDGKSKTLQHWSFIPNDNSEIVTVYRTEGDTDFSGEQIGELKLHKDDSLDPNFCFELPSSTLKCNTGHF